MLIHDLRKRRHNSEAYRKQLMALTGIWLLACAVAGGASFLLAHEIQHLLQ